MLPVCQMTLYGPHVQAAGVAETLRGWIGNVRIPRPPARFLCGSGWVVRLVREAARKSSKGALKEAARDARWRA